MLYRGPLFRAINPIYAREPMSGRGAELYGGRFNPKGVAALYMSLSVVTAIKEANQVGNLQPTTLVSYDAEIESVFDAKDVDALSTYGVDVPMISADNWRDLMKRDREAPSQAFARRLIDDGFSGLLIQSFAPGASAQDVNLILWKWGSASPARLTLIDDEKRFSHP